MQSRDGAVPGGGDAFLQRAHFGCEVRLVADGGRHTAKQCGHFGTGLGEAENIIDEQEDVLVLHVTEVFRNRRAREADA